MASFKLMMVAAFTGTACNLLAMPDDSVSKQREAELVRAIANELSVGAPRADVVRFMDKHVRDYDFQGRDPQAGGVPCYSGTAYVAPRNANAVIVSLCLSSDGQTYASSSVEIHYTWF